MTTRFDMFMYPPGGTGNYYDNLKSLGAFNLRMSNASPIGHLSATFKVPAVGNEPRGGVPQIFTPYNDLRIYDGAECCWRGRLARAQFTVTNEGRWWELTADGYGAHLGDPIVQTFNFRNLQSSAAVSTLISTYATAIDSTDITATSRTFDNSADITLRGRSLAGLIASAYDARLVALHAERFDHVPEAQVIRAEIVSPLADAVGLVDGYKLKMFHLETLPEVSTSKSLR